MVRYAQRQFGADQRPNLRFEADDARSLGFDARFDLVVSFNALHWVPEQADASRGIHRALKPYGLAHLRLVTRAALTSLEEVAEAVRREPHWADAFASFTDPCEHRLSTYNATYLELALRTGSVLASFDVKLVAAAQRAGVTIFGAA